MKIATPLFACLLLAACGQKGDLYMPDAARPVVVPAAPAASPAADDNASSADEEAERQRQQQNPAGN